MKEEIQALLDSLASMREKANVSAVFGEPVTADGRTVIPVARIAYAFGMGGGSSTAAGEGAPEESIEDTGSSGGGGGVTARPIAVVEVTSQGTRVEPVVDEQKLALAGALLAGWAIFCLTRALVKIFGRPD